MITLIDSNILIDIFGSDPRFGKLSADVLRACMQEGAIFACEIVWAEVATVFTDRITFLEKMNLLGIEFSPINQEGALLAAETWRQYRKKGKKRDRILADFLIGSHAKLNGDRLLTRDRGFYRDYFRGLEILDPSNQ